jgi:GntR family transcriptional repressor for pyruvate dehydrogenase complex
MTNSMTEQDSRGPAETTPKRGHKRNPPWQGSLGQFRGFSPRQAVSDAVLGLIRSGELKPGMRLPSEPQLVEMTGISRSSVREAVRGLQTMGLLEIRRGKGTFVRSIEPANLVDAQMLLMLDNYQVLNDLIEVREGIEPLIVRLAVERATDDDIAALRDHIEQMAKTDNSGNSRLAHLAYHSALVDATHNIILKKVWSLIALFLKDSPLVTGYPSVNDYDVHMALVEAIANHDPEAATAAMSKHIEGMLTAQR